MAKINGNLQVLGSLIDLKPEVLAVEPLVGDMSAPRIWFNDAGALRIFDGTAIQTANVGSSVVTEFSQDVDAGGFKLTNLAAPVAGTDAARKIDIENALAGLDYQADVLAILNDGDTAVVGRYIVGTYAGTGSDVSDIVAYDGENFTSAYDVSARGEGAIVWDREQGMFLRWDGLTWDFFEGLSEITTGNGLDRTGNEIFVKADAGIVVTAAGVAVDTSVIATKAELADYLATANLETALAASTVITDIQTSVTNVQTSVTDLTARIEASYFEYTPGAAGTELTVVHNFGNQYPIVQVVDSVTDTVIGVEEIQFVDANTLTVTLGVAGTPKIVVQGLKAAA